MFSQGTVSLVNVCCLILQTGNNLKEFKLDSCLRVCVLAWKLWFILFMWVWESQIKLKADWFFNAFLWSDGVDDEINTLTTVLHKLSSSSCSVLPSQWCCHVKCGCNDRNSNKLEEKLNVCCSVSISLLSDLIKNAEIYRRTSAPSVAVVNICMEGFISPFKRRLGSSLVPLPCCWFQEEVSSMKLEILYPH